MTIVNNEQAQVLFEILREDMKPIWPNLVTREDAMQYRLKRDWRRTSMFYDFRPFKPEPLSQDVLNTMEYIETCKKELYKSMRYKNA